MYGLLFKKWFFPAGNKRGITLFLVMGLIALLALSSSSMSSMLQNDARLIKRVKEKEEARFVAEAGVSHGFAKMTANGFASRANFNGSLDTGTYAVTYSTSGGRYLITSVGTVGGVSTTVTAEFRDVSPSALDYFSGAGNNVMMKVHVNVYDAYINGDIHANNNVELYTQNNSHFAITGGVSATGTVKEGVQYQSPDSQDGNLYINGVNSDGATVTEGAPRIVFPTFDYDSYRAEAVAGGSYYNTNKTFSSTTLSPSNGIVYVDGDVTISGHVDVNGGLIANNILVSRNAELEMENAGDRNVLIAKTGNITIRGKLEVEKGLVYANQDITTQQNWGPVVDIEGLMLAGRNITMWNERSIIHYQYFKAIPEDMTEPQTKLVVSWNK